MPWTCPACGDKGDGAPPQDSSALTRRRFLEQALGVAAGLVARAAASYLE